MISEQEGSCLDQPLTRRDTILILSSLGSAFVAGGIVGYVGKDAIRELSTPPYSPEGKFIANEGEFYVEPVEMPIRVAIELPPQIVTRLFTASNDENESIAIPNGTVALFRKPQLDSPVFIENSAIKPYDSYSDVCAAPVFGEVYNAHVSQGGRENIYAPSSHYVVHEGKEYQGGLWYVLMSPDNHGSIYEKDKRFRYCSPQGELLEEGEDPYYIPSVFVELILYQDPNPALT